MEKFEEAEKMKKKKRQKERKPAEPKKMTQYFPPQFEIPSQTFGPYRIFLKEESAEELKQKI